MVLSGFRRFGNFSFTNQRSKSNIGCPQQPPTEKVLKSVKIRIFADPFHKKGPVLVILGPRIIKPS
jgi:hypothetical protein